MGLTNPRVVQTPEFLQPNVRRQFLLTPNIRLIQSEPKHKMHHPKEHNQLGDGNARPDPLLFRLGEPRISNKPEQQRVRSKHHSLQPKRPVGVFRHSSPPPKIGGADRDRTGGLLVANQALSQLSYSPDRKVSMFQSFEGFKETP
jgi:hypothetical protein